MADFTLRSENVDVEQIMRQIRMRIKEKRGVDYTEEEVRELASAKLEKFLDPRAIRSELVEHYRRQRPLAQHSSAAPDNYAFEESTLYESHRGFVRFARKLLNPLLKLFFNPNQLVQVLHRQGKINAFTMQQLDRFVGLEELKFEVFNNVVLEMTRLGIEVKNLRMRLEAMSARQEFNERRARAFEGLVQEGAETGPPAPGPEESSEHDTVEGRQRRRRRRRGRRRSEGEASPAEPVAHAPAETASEPARPASGGGSPEPAGPSSEPGTER